MRNRKLGGAGLAVSEQGLGGMGMSAFYGALDDPRSAVQTEYSLFTRDVEDDGVLAVVRELAGVAAGERYAPAGMRTVHR